MDCVCSLLHENTIHRGSIATDISSVILTLIDLLRYWNNYFSRVSTLNNYNAIRSRERGNEGGIFCLGRWSQRHGFILIAYNNAIANSRRQVRARNLGCGAVNYHCLRDRNYTPRLATPTEVKKAAQRMRATNAVANFFIGSRGL